MCVSVMACGCADPSVHILTVLPAPLPLLPAPACCSGEHILVLCPLLLLAPQRPRASLRLPHSHIPPLRRNPAPPRAAWLATALAQTDMPPPPDTTRPLPPQAWLRLVWRSAHSVRECTGIWRCLKKGNHSPQKALFSVPLLLPPLLVGSALCKNWKWGAGAGRGIPGKGHGRKMRGSEGGRNKERERMRKRQRRVRAGSAGEFGVRNVSPAPGPEGLWEAGSPLRQCALRGTGSPPQGGVRGLSLSPQTGSLLTGVRVPGWWV